MTDRKPDDLYDALRDRLADYGQEPPAALWADIRAQLPPPVAAPQLRKRRRRTAAWLFLVMLTMAAVGAGWHWQGANRSTKTASGARQRDSHNSSSNASHTNTTSPQNAIATSHAHRPTVALSQPVATQTSSAAAPRVAADAAAGTAGASVAGPAASAGSMATNSSTATAAPASAVTLVPADVTVSASTKAAAVSSAAQTASRGTTGRPAGSAAGLAAKEPASNSGRWNNSSPRAARGQAQEMGTQAASVASATSQLPGIAKSAVAIHGAARPVRNASTAAITRLSQALAGTKKPSARPRRQPTAAMVAVATPAAGQPLPPASTPPTVGQPTIQPVPTTAAASIAPAIESRFSQRAALPLLPARAVAVRPGAWPGLTAPQPVAIVPSSPPLPFTSRWAVQVVAGPALTYRALSAAGPGTPTSPPLWPTTGTTSPVATLERPALGSAAQVAVRRTLGNHWSLSAGLGYAEYASALALQQVHPATTRTGALSPDSAASIGIHRRDTYRFVTVPVRAGFGWALSGRWRVGLLAGAEAAVYVGGSSTEGSTCACQSQTWSFSGSPYRRYSLGASLGAEARYRLAGGRWELLAQPMATYLFTPLANYTPYYQRHLFGAATLFGVALNLP